MLIGYDGDGQIQFIFTDDAYLNRVFPNNSAKISNFWGVSSHNLKELFIKNDEVEGNIEDYKVVDGQLVKREVK